MRYKKSFRKGRKSFGKKGRGKKRGRKDKRISNVIMGSRGGTRL